MKGINRTTALLATLWICLLWSTASAAVLLPQQNFLVVTSSDDSIADYHERFGEGFISGEAYRELVISMNGSAQLGRVTFSEALFPGLVLTLPGMEALKPFAAHLSSDREWYSSPENTSTEVTSSAAGNYGVTGVQSPSVKLVEVTQPPASKRSRPHDSVMQHVYTVKFGDTLFSIARKYRLDMLMLAELNSLQAPYRLIAGQTLMLGAKPTPGTTAEIVVDSPTNVSVYTGASYSKPFTSAKKTTVARVELSAIALNESKEIVTDKDASDHSTHLHELLFQSDFIMFCMSEADATGLLAELRKNFDGMLSQDMGDQAYTPVTQYLKDRGYLRAHTEHDSEGRKRFFVTGPRYQVASLDIVPKQRGDIAQQQYPNVSLPVNQFFSPLLEQRLSAVAIDWLAERGYPLVDLSNTQWKFDDLRHSVRLQLQYDALNSVKVAAVTHKGVQTLSPRQLNTLSPFSESEPYSKSSLEQFRERLMSTGYYDSVSFELLADESRGYAAHRLEVTTSSTKRGDIRVGVGHAAGRGPVLNALLTIPNSTGNQDDLSLNALADDFGQQTEFTYGRSNFLWYGVDLGLSTRAAKYKNPYFMSDAAGVDVMGAWHAEASEDGSSWQVSLGWSDADERRLGAVDTQSFEYGKLTVGWTGKHDGVAGVDRDWSVTLAHAVSLSRQTDNYWSLSAQSKWKSPAILDQIVDLRLGTEIRYARDLQAIPLSAQLFHGGEATNRGFESASFSSLEFDAKSTAYLAYAQLEKPWHTNLQSSWLTQLIPFLDLSVMGADGDEVEAKTFGSIGLGMAGELAGYPYRVDFAVPFNGQAGNGFLINFNIGQVY